MGKSAEDARVQEDPTGDDLSDIVDHAAQLRYVDGDVADLLLRVRGAAVGHRQAGRAVHGVRRQVSREMQGLVKRRLSST